MTEHDLRDEDLLRRAARLVAELPVWADQTANWTGMSLDIVDAQDAIEDIEDWLEDAAVGYDRGGFDAAPQQVAAKRAALARAEAALAAAEQAWAEALRGPTASFVVPEGITLGPLRR